MKLKSLAFLVLLYAIPAFPQDATKRIALTDKSDVPATEISKELQKKECRNVSITDDVANSDFSLEIVRRKVAIWNYNFELALFDRDGIIFRDIYESRLVDAVKELCQALKNKVIVVEVVDPENLTQTEELSVTTGRITVAGDVATRTIASAMRVVVNDEHALLDCYAKGCVPIGPGKYYGEFDPDKRSIWVDHDIPLTHQHVRDHYVIAGSW